MKAPLLRLCRFIGLTGLLVIALEVGFIVLALSVGGVALLGAIVPIGVLVYVAAHLTWVAGDHQKAAAVLGYRNELFGLLDSQNEFCLVLRPFGRDGMTIVPSFDRMKSENYGKRGRYGLRANTTIEQVVGTAARSMKLRTFAIVDPRVTRAPLGLTFMSAPPDEWQMVVQSLIARAHTIVLLIPAKAEARAGFRWELEQIVDLRRQSRVIIVLPPPQVGGAPHQDALLEARAAIAHLAGATPDEYGIGQPIDPASVLPRETLVARVGYHARDAQWWVPVQRPTTHWRQRLRRQIVTDITYREVLVAAIAEVEAEMADWDFDSRYAV